MDNGAREMIGWARLAVPLIASRLLPLPKLVVPVMVPAVSASVDAPLPKTMSPVMVPLLVTVTAPVPAERSMARRIAAVSPAAAVMVPLLVMLTRLPDRSRMA